LRIVLDTNVVVSGLLSPFGAPGMVLRLVSDEAVALCLDARVIAEYATVLSRPGFDIDQADVASLLDAVVRTGEMAASAPLARRLPHAADEPFLEVAIAARADCLVTGNTRHYPENARAGVAVLTPAAFIEQYRAASQG
jgi:putative PIN family toxin of toxin-antitoxin system